MTDFEIRYAQRADLERVNELRAMVSEVHVTGRPDRFRPGFCEELREHLATRWDAGACEVIVAVQEGIICGFATVESIHRPLSPYALPQDYYRIEEFGVDAAYRRRGIARALISFCRQEARRKGFARIELDVWEFNEDALQFYEAVGFRTFRRYLELDVPEDPDC